MKPIGYLRVIQSRTKYFDVIERIAPRELGLKADNCSVVYAGEDELSSSRGRLVPYAGIPSILGFGG